MRDGTLGSVLKETYFLQGPKLVSKDTHLFVDSSKHLLFIFTKSQPVPYQKNKECSKGQS